MARVAVVTGGTRGIGEAISVGLKDAGYKVAAVYAGNDEKAREFTERTGIAAFKWDVSNFEACKEGLAKVAAELGALEGTPRVWVVFSHTPGGEHNAFLPHLARRRTAVDGAQSDGAVAILFELPASR